MGYVSMVLFAALAFGPKDVQEPGAYGLGAPLPEAVIDYAEMTIKNELSVFLLREDAADDRTLFVVDSLAIQLKAAVRRTLASAFTAYTFRWHHDPAIDRDSVIASVREVPDFDDVIPGILVGVAAESATAYGPSNSWPDPAIDTERAAITNEITIRFHKELDDERIAFLVDSIAQALSAAVTVTRAITYTEWQLRWPAKLMHNENYVATILKAIPEVRSVRRGAYATPHDGRPEQGSSATEGMSVAYGLGAPWPDAVIDNDSKVILNELTFELAEGVSEERARFLADSLARELNAAARYTKAPTYISYTFRWLYDPEFDQDEALLTIEALPEVARVRPGIVVQANQR